MNDPKDIVVSIENFKEEITLNQSTSEKNNEKKIEENDQSHKDNILFHLYENLGKQFYKKTLREIDLLIQNNYFQGYSKEWKIYILRIRALLKIVKNKVRKYLIFHFEKAKIKHHINNIKKYLNQIQLELNNFFDNFVNENTIKEGEKICYLLRCYFEYTFIYSSFHFKIGNVIEALSYLSLALRLYKETDTIAKTERIISHIEKNFILLCQIFIYNEDYISTIEYLNLTMDICIKHLIFDTTDCNDGIFVGDKEKVVHLVKKIENPGLNKKKYDNEKENHFGNKIVKRVIIHIIILFFYRGICYENLGKMKNAIRCYYQCLWFINHFFYDYFNNFKTLIKKILAKSLDFKEAVDYLKQKISNYERIQSLIKKQKKTKESDKKNKEEKNLFIFNSLYFKKYQKLTNILSKLTINEVDTINKFEIKKNIKELSSKKREGRDKNMFLSDIRLLEAYIREDFREIIDKMDKIKSFDMDFSQRENIQKVLRRIYFEKNQKELKNKKKMELVKKNNLIKSKAFIFKDENSNKDKFQQLITIKKKNILPTNKTKVSSSNCLTPKETEKNYSFKTLKTRAQSAFSDKRTNSKGKEKNRRLFSPFTFRSDFKSQTVNISQNSIKNLKNTPFIKRNKNMRINSAKTLYKIKKEDKNLNNFFNKKYIEKRNYIKKLEDREFKFQKCILKLKDNPKSPIQIYNKEVMKQNANQSFQKIMSLFLSNPVNWRDNLSPKQIRNIMLYDRMENAMIKSLDNNALTKFKNEENKQKKKKHYNIKSLNISTKDINKKNNNILNDIDNKIEQLKQKKNIENKKYQKLLKSNRKYIRHRDDKKRHDLYNNYELIKYKSENISPIYNSKRFSFINNNDN